VQLRGWCADHEQRAGRLQGRWTGCCLRLRLVLPVVAGRLPAHHRECHVTSNNRRDCIVKISVDDRKDLMLSGRHLLAPAGQVR
jgi:hypothetical protein